MTSNRPTPQAGGRTQPPDGALLRLPVQGDRLSWLPRAPAGADVSASFSSAAAAGAAAEVLAELGYRVVGVASSGATGPVADFLVSQAVLDAHPQWWRTLVARADRAFSLAAGPVQVALAEVLRAHRSGAR